MKVYYIWRDKKEIKMKRSRKRKKNKTLSRSKKGLIILIIITVLLCVVTILKKQEQSKEYTENKSDYIDSVKPDIDVELLTPNEYSRPGIATNKITGIVVHYTANPGATAMNNRDYFEGLKDSHITKASSNFAQSLLAADIAWRVRSVRRNLSVFRLYVRGYSVHHPVRRLR